MARPVISAYPIHPISLLINIKPTKVWKTNVDFTGGFSKVRNRGLYMSVCTRLTNLLDAPARFEMRILITMF